MQIIISNIKGESDMGGRENLQDEGYVVFLIWEEEEEKNKKKRISLCNASEPQIHFSQESERQFSCFKKDKVKKKKEK